MENKDDILLAIRAARKDLKEGRPFRAEEMLALLEGMAHFLDKELFIELKCRNCDNYAKSFFPLEGDFYAVDNHEYCHAKKISLPNLNWQKIGSCMEYTDLALKEMENQANSIVEEDFKAAFAERKLYDRTNFASYKVSFNIHKDAGKVCIEFGHRSGEEFIAADMKLCILRRLDPGIETEAAKKIAPVIEKGPVVFVEANEQTRRQLDIDYILEYIALKRKMNIVYL
jgi:hypothetical protein